MARRYDSKTTIFSPEGRLFQVEYAMEAIGHAGTCLGILANDGILLAAERRNTNKLLGRAHFVTLPIAYCFKPALFNDTDQLFVE